MRASMKFTTLARAAVNPVKKIVPLALDWLDRNRDRSSWFMHLHLRDPHTPYRDTLTEDKDIGRESRTAGRRRDSTQKTRKK